jgi:triosephosphate isomerase (TIM)
LVEGSSHCEIIICPSFLDVRIAVTAARRTRIQIGVQNLYWEKDGAFTGEVLGSAIKASGCSHVIVGHSERRKNLGETDAIVFKETLAAIDAHLIPIVCIGEREKGNAQAALTEQFEHAIGLLSEEHFEQIVVAYEPIWAIGSAAAATPETAADAHCFIRAQAKSSFGAKGGRLPAHHIWRKR